MEGVHLILLLLIGILCSAYGEFRVSGPSHPVVAIVGEDAVLECYLVPQVFVNNMVVRWFKSDIRLPVHAYRNGQDDTAAQHQAYRKRTELFQDEVSKGNVSLRIKNTRVSDEGKYLCTVDDTANFEETTIELKVGDGFFPSVSGWLVFLSLMLCLVIIILIAGIIWIVKQLRNIKELQHDKMIVQYVSVTLDTETANPKLEVSKDQKNVRLTQIALSVHDNEERFTVYESMLGSEGFTSGSHYWEVEFVGNQHWTVGVATESVERKREIQLTPKNGFWTIGRTENKFQANFEKTSDIQTGEIPRKIGVYLSYESGIVSFYSTGTKIYLYTFTGCEFTEKVYPFFSTTHCDKWLRICPV
ncbi:hypothetical protein chiPu_0021671 [Chiloscyllium punctatum]|uniref:Butyrophilin subfamily 1 member A1-like n=1 Tax=Chiloscyllium punctatum TaxID=137246 RepID=A0A401RJX3_CHIPU|nr:hypothetical protein [Chiloscyllium punctatum]